jgi:hypothetical protein
MAYVWAVLTTVAAWAWIQGHQILLCYVGAVLIERLPPPDSKSGKFYGYVYSVLQVFAANTKRSQDAVTTINGPKL